MESRDLLSSGSGVVALDRAELRRRLPRFAAMPSASRRRVRGDHDLNPGMSAPAELREAAVLVPLVEREPELTILLTERTAHLAAHAGQISFPGGGVEAEDRDEIAAALREVDEEIGLPEDRIDVIGRLDTYVTRTGFRVEPIVGLVRPPFALQPDANEVADVFEVPLSFVLDPANLQRHSRMFQGRRRYFYAFPFQDRYIWGATAGMLLNLREALSGAA